MGQFASSFLRSIIVERKTFQVPNIGCDGCVRTIKTEVSQISGVKQVDGVVDTKTVTVEWDTPCHMAEDRIDPQRNRLSACNSDYSVIRQ
jgi:copper chaperone CopZ